MAATYDPTLPTDLDHVRRLVSDTDVANAQLEDEEINALITEETATGQSLKYFAAATVMAILQAKWQGRGKGVIEKEVNNELRTEFGISGRSGTNSLDLYIDALRKRGAQLLSGTEYFVLGVS